jgi:hypothetical protein
VESPQSVDSIINHPFEPPFLKGIVIYTIAPDDLKTFQQHTHDITALKKSWPVLVCIHHTKMNPDFERYFKNFATMIVRGRIQ